MAAVAPYNTEFSLHAFHLQIFGVNVSILLQFQFLQEDIAQILQRYAESGDVSDIKSSYQQILDSGTHGTDFDLIWVFTIWNEQTSRIWEMKTYNDR